MQPSTHQTAPGACVAGLPADLLALVVVAGSASLFATYWDDAWHTDLGRDSATIPPHLPLYASMATIGAVVAAWGLSALWRDRSPAAVWRQPRPAGGLPCRARPDTAPWILTSLGALLLGSAAVPVLELETDVPQFRDPLYLPVLLATTLFTAMVLRQVLPGPLPVARAVGSYVLLWGAITHGVAGGSRQAPGRLGP